MNTINQLKAEANAYAEALDEEYDFSETFEYVKKVEGYLNVDPKNTYFVEEIENSLKFVIDTGKNYLYIQGES